MAIGNQDFSFIPHATRQGTWHHRTDPCAELPGLKGEKKSITQDHYQSFKWQQHRSVPWQSPTQELTWPNAAF